MLLLYIGRNAWTAFSSDFAQYLIIDLGQTMTITSIMTQGRAESSEYVETFGISYGSNGLDYAEYKESSGNTKVNNNETIHIIVINYKIFSVSTKQVRYK